MSVMGERMREIRICFDRHSTTILRTLRTDVGELDTSGCDELQSFVYVLGFLHTHTRSLVIAPQ
jgi:hypothetical protein